MNILAKHKLLIIITTVLVAIILLLFISIQYLFFKSKITVQPGENTYIGQTSQINRGDFLIFRSGNVKYEFGSMKGNIALYDEAGNLKSETGIDNLGNILVSTKNELGASFYSNYVNVGVTISPSGIISKESKIFDGYPKNLIGPSPENAKSTFKWKVVYYNIGSLDGSLQVAFKYDNLKTKVENELRLKSTSSAANFGIIDDKLIYLWNDSSNWGTGNDPLYLGVYDMNSNSFEEEKISLGENASKTFVSVSPQEITQFGKYALINGNDGNFATLGIFNLETKKLESIKNYFTSEDIAAGTIKYKTQIGDDLFLFNSLGYGNLVGNNFELRQSIKFEKPNETFSFSDFKVFSVEVIDKELILIGENIKMDGNVYDRDALVLKYEILTGKLIKSVILKTPESVGNGSIGDVDNMVGVKF